MNLDSKRLVFVTGKGGVGKSVTAAALAWREARKGRRVCLFELGSHSFYESFFQTRGISYEPSEIVHDVHISLLTPEGSLREYVLHFLKVPKLYDLFFQNKVMKSFLNAAPALSELSILGKLTSEIRGILKHEYDVFIVDCFSTGHALALLRAPKGLTSAFRAGPLYDQARDIDAILHDPALTHYVLVTLPEEMPVTEAREFYGLLKDDFRADISLVCNQLMTPPLTLAEQKTLATEVRDPHMHEFLEFIQFKEKLQAQQLDKLKALDPRFYGVPQILNAAYGQEYVEKIATYLDKPWTSSVS